MKSKQEYTDEMNELISEYANKLKNGAEDISDSEMQRITDLFYMRDWNVETKGHNVEGMAFQRGMVLGMILYRQILAKSKS